MLAILSGEKKGLEIYAYCIMHSHIHLMCKATNGFILSDVMRDLKKFTSKKNYSNYYRRTRESQEWLWLIF
jgi:REP element-mobilizing transposase RayT